LGEVGVNIAMSAGIAPCGAESLVKELQGRGFRLESSGGRLRVWPTDRLTEGDRERLREMRGDVLATLQRNGENGENGETAAGTGEGRVLPGEPSAAPSSPWDQAEADRLLAELREQASWSRSEDFGGRFPEVVGHVVEDLLAVAEGYVANQEQEAARGWDALQLLRGVGPVLRDVLTRATDGQRTARGVRGA
jgi:hypothetical protein